jgi:Tfp pilus assembly PilM family ATPase
MQGIQQLAARLPFARERRPRAPSQATALEVDGTTLRAAMAGPGGRIIRVATVQLEFPADADRSDATLVGKAVGRALDRLKWKAGMVVMGVPRARVVLRNFALPSGTAPGELASLVHFQASKDLPFRTEEAVVDFQVCRELPAPVPVPPLPGEETPAGPAPEIQPPRLDVLVAAVKADEVAFHVRLAEAAGFRLSALGLLPAGNARSAAAIHPGDGTTACALVTLRPDDVGIEVVAGGALLFSRGTALKPPAESSPATASAVIEVVRSIHGYAGNATHPTLGHVLVAGTTGNEPELAEALASRLGIPCQVADPAAALRLPDDSAGPAPGALAAIGLAMAALDPSGLPIDFLAPKRPPVPRDLRKIRIVATLAAVAVVGIFVFGLRTVLKQRREAILKATLAELEDAEKKVPAYRKLIQQATVVDGWIKGRHDWLEHVAYLTSVLPPSDEIYVKSLAIGGNGGIRLDVQARSGETLARLGEKIHAAGYDVKPLAINPGADRFGYEFRSTVELGMPGKLLIDLQKVKPPPRPIDDVSAEPSAYRRTGG